jgi:hypothetical protein
MRDCMSAESVGMSKHDACLQQMGHGVQPSRAQSSETSALYIPGECALVLKYSLRPAALNRPRPIARSCGAGRNLRGNLYTPRSILVEQFRTDSRYSQADDASEVLDAAVSAIIENESRRAPWEQLWRNGILACERYSRKSGTQKNNRKVWSASSRSNHCVNKQVYQDEYLGDHENPVRTLPNTGLSSESEQ